MREGLWRWKRYEPFKNYIKKSLVSGNVDITRQY